MTPTPPCNFSKNSSDLVAGPFPYDTFPSQDDYGRCLCWATRRRSDSVVHTDFKPFYKYLLIFSHTSQKYEWTVVILDNRLDCCLWCKNLVLLRLLTEWTRYVENQEEIIRALAQISETKKERAAIIAQPRVSIYKCVGCWCSMEEN